MIAFDNGPANGDYVRYIDELTKRAAIAASAGILTDNDAGATTLAKVRKRLAAEAARDRPHAAAGEWVPGGTSIVASSQTTGFAPTTAVTPRETAAAAIASALMSGQMGNRLALPTHIKIGLGAIVIGIVLILAGFFWEPFNFVIVAGGGALIVWAVRMMRDTSARSSATRL
ncbi:MAG: hypothetical protein ABI277_14470 [Burkholderiaceae bacterium]